nr:hypothetical protein [Enterococcus faecium]
MLLDALLEISDSDPLLRYYVDSTTHEIILSFLGKVQMEVINQRFIRILKRNFLPKL